MPSTPPAAAAAGSAVTLCRIAAAAAFTLGAGSAAGIAVADTGMSQPGASAAVTSLHAVIAADTGGPGMAPDAGSAAITVMFGVFGHCAPAAAAAVTFAPMRAAGADIVALVAFAVISAAMTGSHHGADALIAAVASSRGAGAAGNPDGVA